ncbi:MAG: hypothetical protein QJR13_03425 [Bacillota bacterium]|nr:hypothetical protein [Bacillota bacterium]
MSSGRWRWNREERAMEMGVFQRQLEELWLGLKARENKGTVDSASVQEASRQVDHLLQALFPSPARSER